VTLHAQGGSFLARAAILTPPKPLIGRITFSPALPPAHDQLLQRQPMGSVVKVNAIYSTPFWRSQGLNGTATSDTGPIRITYDNSPEDGRPGVLVGFMEGNDSRAFYGASRATRRRAALDSLARYFGEPARHPIGYVDLAWAEETYTRGAYGSFNPPGVLTALRDATVAPVGRLHFAGADTSPLWPGYMDGAIRSGERAAQEALAAL
jgi:monoamine oxidase